ncbi:MAG: hypothetical protein ACRCTE_14175 [Cellulosilyticaceae bacterium]
MNRRIFLWSYIAFLVLFVGGVSRWYLSGVRNIYEQSVIQETEQTGLHFQMGPEVIGDQSALFVAKLSKINATPFEEGKDVYEFEYSKEGTGSASASWWEGLSEDRKVRYMVLKMNYQDIHEIESVTVGVVREGDRNCFKITTPLIKNYKNKSIKVNRQIKVGESDISIQEIIIEPLGMIIKGVQEEDGRKLALVDEGVVAIQMKDGEQIGLHAYDVEGIFEKAFEYRFGHNEIEEIDGIFVPRVIDSEEIEAVVVGDIIIKMEEVW